MLTLSSQENKLSKEENLALLKKLSKSKIDTSQLQSSRSLGQSLKGSKRFAPTSEHEPKSHNRNTDYDSDESDADLLEKNRNSSIAPVSDTQPTTTVGSGLKRPLELGPDGFPILKKRKRTPKPKNVQPPEPAWEGFDSGDENKGGEEQTHIDSGDGNTSEINEPESSAESSTNDSESESESESESALSEENARSKASIKPRNSAFKSWAVQQINEAVGFKPTEHAPPTQQHEYLAKHQKPRNVAEEDPLPPELQIPQGDPNRKAFAVQVDRPEDIQNSRLGLPVVSEEQRIMEAIHNNSSVVIWGATGSGKTTQIPQFLFEAGFGNPDSPNPGMIAVTQPRRVAAVSMAKRVGDELGQFSNRVAYQIRFDSTVAKNTAVKFMTDGVLIREIAKDFSLSKYSVIIVDEAHERSVNTDILIGMVSRIVDLRKTMSSENPNIRPLKLVIMSATLRISDFIRNTHLFKHGTPPLVQSEGRQYPVTIHFSRRTHRDYVEEAFRKVSKGHKKLPPGAFLVFLTGQSEIKALAKGLKQTFKSTRASGDTNAQVQLPVSEAPVEAEDIDIGGREPGSVDDGDGDDSDVEITGLDQEEDDEDFDHEEGAVDSKTLVHVLPLYSQLPTKEQLKVFEAPPDGSRLIVLATNVAETSLTIPGVRYVFDCGRSKEKQYDVSTGIQSFRVGWISKASANQRAGRAGRTGPGHCYRLYSSAIYEGEFKEYTDPEILRTPIEGVVLQMKSMGLQVVSNFPFPTPPNRTSLAKAEKLLQYLGALSLDNQITAVGRSLSIYPLSPRFSKMLHIGYQHGCMPYVVAMVSALSVSDLFVQESQANLVSSKNEGDGVYTNADRLEETERESRKKQFNRSRNLLSKYDSRADALRFLAAVCAYSYAGDGDNFCSDMFLQPNAMKEAAQLRRQLHGFVHSNNPGLLKPYEARLPEPSEKQIRALKQITAAGFIDQVAIRADLAPTPPEIPRKPKRAIDVPYLTLFPPHEGFAKELSEKAVYIHPSSILARLSASELPQYLIYSHLQQSTPSFISEQASKIRMFPLTSVSGSQISALAHETPLLEYGKPVGKIEAVTGSSDKRECWVIPSLVGEHGSTGWPLPARKAIQKKDIKMGWVIEKFLN